jgi:hypothetical protein
MSKRKILLSFILMLCALTLAWFFAGSPVDTKRAQAKAQVDFVSEVANANLESIRSLAIKSAAPMEEGFAASGLLKPSALFDPWGEKLLVKCVDKKCTRLNVLSNGPNRINNNGQGDDIVSSK